MSALEIERCLLDHPYVQACSVVGLQDEIYGEVVGAVVVARDNANLTAEDIVFGINNTLGDGLVAATRTILIDFLNTTFPRVAARLAPQSGTATTRQINRGEEGPRDNGPALGIVFHYGYIQPTFLVAGTSSQPNDRSLYENKVQMAVADTLGMDPEWVMQQISHHI